MYVKSLATALVIALTGTAHHTPALALAPDGSKVGFEPAEKVRERLARREADKVASTPVDAQASTADKRKVDVKASTNDKVRSAKKHPSPRKPATDAL